MTTPADAAPDRGHGCAPEMEDAAWTVLGRGLRGEPSVIDPSVRWSADAAREIMERIEKAPDTGSGTFLGKLEGQLASASRDALVVYAEMMYLHSLPLVNIHPATKADRIETVLGWAQPPLSLPDEMRAGTQLAGAFNGGMGFNVQMWNQLTWFARMLVLWFESSESARAEALADPWAMDALLRQVPSDVPSIRYSLEYLAWPGVFPAVTSPDHRKRIRAAFAHEIGGESGPGDLAITRDIVAIRVAQEAAAGEWVDWYDAPYHEQWNPTFSPERPPKAWLVRPGDGGGSLVQSWEADSFVSLKAANLVGVSPESTRAEVREAVRNGYNHIDRAQQEQLTRAFTDFLQVMRDGDIVVTISDNTLRIGRIAGDAELTAQAASRLRRAAEWSAQLPGDALNEPLPTLLTQQGSVIDLTSAYDQLAALLPDAIPTSPTTAPPTPPPVEKVPTLPAVTDEIARSLHMDRTILQRLVDVLQTRQQLVLYGPPGTGKTYVAKVLAQHLAGADDASRVRLVQFHPSYSYEDFFEGYRPVLTEQGVPGFELRNGPLKEIAAEASNPDNWQNVYVLIIDEMNRANLAKVFGELYFLLEYRSDSMRLQYRPDEAFRLPKNLFIIGTMNTADRSITMVDAAIRRRFPFFELHPAKEPVKGVLEHYIGNPSDERIGLLKALNEAIGDEGRDLQIGPSYLMREGADTADGLELIWQFDILPLLYEHFHPTAPEQIDRDFGLPALRRVMADGATQAQPVPSQEAATEAILADDTPVTPDADPDPAH